MNRRSFLQTAAPAAAIVASGAALAVLPEADLDPWTIERMIAAMKEADRAGIEIASAYTQFVRAKYDPDGQCRRAQAV
jgi:hypothetical protein